jgi:hypothetical protein
MMKIPPEMSHHYAPNGATSKSNGNNEATISASSSITRPAEVSQGYANNDSLPRTATANFLKIEIAIVKGSVNNNLSLRQVAF